MYFILQIEVKLKKVDGIRWEKLETEQGPHPSEGETYICFKFIGLEV